MVFLADMRPIKIANLVISIEGNQQVSIPQGDITRHAIFSLIISLRIIVQVLRLRKEITPEGGGSRAIIFTHNSKSSSSGVKSSLAGRGLLLLLPRRAEIPFIINPYWHQVL
jgi:hypothetical protein